MDNGFDEELNARLDRIEGPGGGGMIQNNLPWRDFALSVGGLGIVSALLVVWAVA